MTNHVLQNAIEAARRELAYVAMSETNDGLSWTDCTGFTASSIEGNTALIARTAVEAAWKVFTDFRSNGIDITALSNRVHSNIRPWVGWPRRDSDIAEEAMRVTLRYLFAADIYEAVIGERVAMAGKVGTLTLCPTCRGCGTTLQTEEE